MWTTPAASRPGCAASTRPEGKQRVSELHKFIFEGLPVRGAIVRLQGAWREMLARRAANTTSGAYPVPVRELLGEMALAGVLMQSSIKFNGALVLQIFGDGPLRLAVAEVQLGCRCAPRPRSPARSTKAPRSRPWSTWRAAGAAPLPWIRGTNSPASNPIRAWCRWWMRTSARSVL